MGFVDFVGSQVLSFKFGWTGERQSRDVPHGPCVCDCAQCPSPVTLCLSTGDSSPSQFYTLAIQRSSWRGTLSSAAYHSNEESV